MQLDVGLSQSPSEDVTFDDLQEGPESLELTGGQLLALWEEGVWNSLCLLAISCNGVSSSDLVGVSKCLLRAMNLALLVVCGSLSLYSSELLLVIALAFSDLALAHLGEALLMEGGSGVEVFFN